MYQRPVAAAIAMYFVAKHSPYGSALGGLAEYPVFWSGAAGALIVMWAYVGYLLVGMWRRFAVETVRAKPGEDRRSSRR